MMTNEQDIAPTEIEALLPWYAAGTLRRRDRQRVEAALLNEPGLARQAELAREELAETISLNESLGVPTARAMDRLMAGIDEETRAARKPASARVVAGRFATFIAGFSPRTLAIAASVACLAIALQATVLVSLLTKPAAEQSIAANDTARGRGSYAMVRFAREASAAEITRFLENNQATLVDGPRPGGVYRVRIAVSKLAKDEFVRIVSRMRQDRVVASAEPVEPSE
jgi:anti-sigma-K factor RskA